MFHGTLANINISKDLVNPEKAKLSKKHGELWGRRLPENENGIRSGGPNAVDRFQPPNSYLLVFDLFALAFAFEFVLFVVAGVVAGVDIGVGDFAALVLLAVLFAGCGPHPPWQPYATTVKMRTSVSAIAFFILVFDLLSSSKIKYSSKFSRFREIPPSSKM